MADDENQVHQGGVDQDHELALQLQAELNASARAPARTIRLMVKPGAVAGAGAGRPPEPPNGPVSQRPSRAASMSQGMNYYDDRSQSNYTSRAATASGGEDSRDDEEDEFMNTDDEEEAQRRADEAKKLRNTAPCMLGDDVLNEMGEETEMVIAHREAAGAHANEGEYDKVPLAGQAAWKHWGVYIKWARDSHVHNTWETYETLRGFGGFKKVLNYCKRVDDLNLRKLDMSVDEREEVDWRENMEEELLKEHQEVDRVFGERLDPQDGTAQFLVKWRGLPYMDASWETEADLLETKYHWEDDGEGRGDAYREKNRELIEAYRRREARALEPRQKMSKAREGFKAAGFGAMAEQPAYLKVGTLRDYQLAGLNWMVYNLFSASEKTNGILADEMGLGKTIQCASLVGYLSEMQRVGEPALVVVPLSTVPNWAKEFAKWIPDVNTLVYVGNSSSRQVIRQFEFPTRSAVPNRLKKFDALITTYEMVLKDAETLSKIKWSALVVDEAHRLKNTEAALYKELKQWKFESKLLVTGTPLQNNIKELWALLHFLHPEKFASCEEFETKYNLQDPASVALLHDLLRPFLLRRVIKDVEKSLPPKRERILRVPMTPLQKQYYKWILTRNFSQLNKNSKGSQIKLLNIIVDLKKVCNHPFLFESAREEYQATTGVSEDIISNLVVTSGKMVLLDKLLGRLKETGHRVLIFSQMVRVLDIISEYMNRKGYRHQRLDGSTPSQKRHQAMDRFNAPDSPDFAFLLSTRAGGLGINLATADTVLLFDSDWNPQNDLQAMARAHRIGQKDSVNIYRLVTGSSVEEDILERAKSKMVLDHVVIQKMDTSGRTVLGKNSDNSAAAVGAKLFNKDELAAILKFGAQDLFKDDEMDEEGGAQGPGAAKDGTVMTDDDLDAILARAEEIEHKSEGGGSGDLMSSFKVATFMQNEDDAAFWNRLIPENERPNPEQEALKQQGIGGFDGEPGIRQARLKTLDYAPMEEALAQPAAPKVSKKRMYKELPGAPVKGAELRIDKWPQAVDEEGRLLGDDSAPRPEGFPLTLCKRDALAFSKGFKKFPHEFKLQELADSVGGQLTGVGMDALLALRFGLLRGCEKAVESFERKKAENAANGIAEDDAEANGGEPKKEETVDASEGTATATANDATATDKNDAGDPESKAKPKGHRAKPPEAHLDFFGVDVRAGELLSLARQMKILDEKMLDKAREQGLNPDQDPSARYQVVPFTLEANELPSITGWTKTSDWDSNDDSSLLIGIYRYGIGEWRKIYDDQTIPLSTKMEAAVNPEMAPPNAMPKASHLETRSFGILRQLEKAKIHPTLKRKRQESKKEKNKKAADEKFATQLGENDSPANVAVRKLIALKRVGPQMEVEWVVHKERKYISIIGAKVDEVTNTTKQRLKIWDYVARKTRQNMDGFALHQMHLRMEEERKNNNRELER